MLYKSWWALLGALPSLSAEAREIIHITIRDHPTYYGGIAVTLSLFGGFVVQYYSWVDGRVTVKKASSELMFSVLAGMIAFLVVASQSYDEYILYTAALLGGMAGRSTANLAQSIAYQFVRSVTANVLRSEQNAFNKDREEIPPT